MENFLKEQYLRRSNIYSYRLRWLHVFKYAFKKEDLKYNAVPHF